MYNSPSSQSFLTTHIKSLGSNQNNHEIKQSLSKFLITQITSNHSNNLCEINVIEFNILTNHVFTSLNVSKVRNKETLKSSHRRILNHKLKFSQNNNNNNNKPEVLI